MHIDWIKMIWLFIYSGFLLPFYVADAQRVFDVASFGAIGDGKHFCFNYHSDNHSRARKCYVHNSTYNIHL